MLHGKVDARKVPIAETGRMRLMASDRHLARSLWDKLRWTRLAAARLSATTQVSPGASERRDMSPMQIVKAAKEIQQDAETTTFFSEVRAVAIKAETLLFYLASFTFQRANRRGR